MSYLGSIGTIQVTVQQTDPVVDRITYDIVDVANNPDNDYTWGGNPVTVGGYVYDQYGDPMPGVPIVVLYPLATPRGTVNTNAQGYYELTFNSPYGTNPSAITTSIHQASMLQGDVRSLPLYGKTRIRGLAATASPKVGEDMGVSGILEWESAAGVWSPISGETVTVEATDPDGISYTVDGITTSTGAFSATFTPDIAGVWTVTATYDGAASMFTASAEVKITLGEELGIGLGLLLIIIAGGVMLVGAAREGR